MENNFNIVLGGRLRKARESFGLTLQEVAGKLGFNNYQALSSIEDGSRQVKAHELAALSKIYFKDITYFIQEKQEEVQSELVLWRNVGQDDKMRREKEGELIKYCRQYFELEKKLGFSHQSSLRRYLDNINDFSFFKAEELAVEVSRDMQLGARPALCLEKILEQRYNVKILYLDFDKSGSGACAVGGFGSAVLINARETPWRRNYDLAHELFHLITWRMFPEQKVDAACDKAGIIEKWANTFASVLLLPGDQVKVEVEKRLENKKVGDLELINIAREFAVSIDALIWRLVNLRYIRTEEAEEWLRKVEIRALDKLERVADKNKAPHISEKYVALAYEAYQKGMISKGKFAEYLNIPRTELEKKLKVYGFDIEEVYNGTLVIA